MYVLIYMSYKIENVIKNIKAKLEEEKQIKDNKTAFNIFLKTFIGETNILNVKKQKVWVRTFQELGYIDREGEYIIFLDKGD